MQVNRAELRKILSTTVPRAQVKTLPKWFDDVVEYVADKFDEYEQKVQEACEKTDGLTGQCYTALRACGIDAYGNYGQQTIDVARRYARTLTTIHNEILSLNSFVSQRDAQNRIEGAERGAAFDRQQKLLTEQRQ